MSTGELARKVPDILLTHPSETQYDCLKQLFGMWDRVLNKGHCERIRDRSATTLLALVEKYILPGTIIYSDNFKAYELLSNMGYVHKVVMHRKRFVDPSTGVHTNNIESMWSRVRYHLRPHYGS
ncbi:hypothetical protein MN116_001396 [Schistosoma mekongi]|uniref:ISXO2-like transposase domain-containing protein n=1 Tax=Schistosoma mekongi TaxID=38744 RepID=A0AAE1ZMI3_SCHME|nr:hypothetical protein MN116_001396 [Schistosoma mekongi]